MDAIESYLSTNRSRHLDELVDLLSIPSISALSEHKADVRHAAVWIQQKLSDAGFEHATLMETGGHPVVYADWLHAEHAPTVLVYGHYDVQPVDPVSLWKTPPFEPTIQGNQIFARGASDDKGPTLMHIHALGALLAVSGKLPVNIKFCIEGEEEIGSAHLHSFMEKEREHFAADLILISDTTMISPTQPAVVYGLRGLTACQIDVRTAASDLHSGLYGGAVPNAIHALVEVLNSLHNPDGSVAVAGFYDKVTPLAQDEKEQYAKLGHDDESYRASLGLTQLHGEPGYTTLERLWARPTLEINGIYGGFQGEGTKTVIPCEAHAKITCRLVPNQDPGEILDLIENHLATHTPTGAQVTLVRQDGGKPYLAPYDHPAIQLASEAYAHAYGTPAVFTRMGGSIPVVETFANVLNIPVVMMGFSLGDENFHAPNEHFSLDNFDKGLRTLCYYYTHLPQAMGQA
ncbi:acetylornithine deacetylase/succinyl-diaminopimelate desuccinylase-like protein [Alicyclobacillus sacchari]|uniref:Acetylornithine deacetylase/succinyl-diaminopimelate desuccinylase-like protein n=1 Tax=Alicyclobacillus sacchari TaxID=392010 RepID=A0A4R8LUI0_9BACL|nr:dipeptidase [Alicyclobacillus sacchari]TDY51324.1 acetylornithine deacetylase/succinyl-diaminopimelate desuccinylase-like protein [Alicyclobacillus sacchari]GMA56628.1 peptidase M20 [Alicyclobacillus sacchari]